jgi:cysteinyl-tRNA synthetase
MHNGFVRVDDEKMSKSLGNFFTIREVLKTYDPEVVRFFILRAHYRSPLNYSDAHLDDARSALTRLYTTLKNVPPVDRVVDWTTPSARRMRAAMDDDFNTPEAMAVLFDRGQTGRRHRVAPRLNGPQRKNLPPWVMIVRSVNVEPLWLLGEKLTTNPPRSRSCIDSSAVIRPLRVGDLPARRRPSTRTLAAI